MFEILAYNHQDETNWKERSLNFQKFHNSMDHTDLYKSFENEFKALFLEEKPAILIIDLKNKFSVKEFLKYDFCILNNYIYNPKMIAKIMTQYPEEFSSYSDVNHIMQVLDKDKINSDENHTTRGLILGIPYSAVKDLEKENELVSNNIYKNFIDSLKDEIKTEFITRISQNINMTTFFQDYKKEINISPQEKEILLFWCNRKTYEGYGYLWIEHKENLDIKIKKIRLEAAFKIMNTCL